MLVGLKGALLQRGLSQREVCRLVPIAENRFSSIVNGWTNPTAEEWRNLAAVLRQSEDVLFDTATSIEIRSGR
jgi:transcriptional regulator with XRE-family HTH domain